MSCEGVLGSIVALLDGELHGDERRTVEVHVGTCAACQGELELLRRTRALLSRQLEGAGAGAGKPSFAELWRRVEALAEQGDGPVARDAAAPWTRRARADGASRRSGRRRLVAWSAAGGLAIAASLALLIVGRPAGVGAPAAKTATTAKPAAVARAAAPVAVAKHEPGHATRVASKGVPADAHPAEGKPAAVADQAAPEGDVVANEEVANEIDPPRELLERPDMFLNYPIVRRLDELRHLESVLAEPPDAGGSG